MNSQFSYPNNSQSSYPNNSQSFAQMPQMPQMPQMAQMAPMPQMSQDQQNYYNATPQSFTAQPVTDNYNSSYVEPVINSAFSNPQTTQTFVNQNVQEPAPIANPTSNSPIANPTTIATSNASVASNTSAVAVPGTTETTVSKLASDVPHSETTSKFHEQFAEYMRGVSVRASEQTTFTVCPDTFEKSRVVLRPVTELTSREGVKYNTLNFAYRYRDPANPNSEGIEGPLIYDFFSNGKNIIMPAPTGIVWSKAKTSKVDEKEKPTMHFVFNTSNTLHSKIVQDINDIYEACKEYLVYYTSNNKNIDTYRNLTLEKLDENLFKSPIYYQKDLSGNSIKNGFCSIYVKIDERKSSSTDFVDVLGKNIDHLILKDVPSRVVPQLIFSRISVVKGFFFQYCMRSCLVMESDPDGSNKQLQALANLVNEDKEEIKRSADNIEALRKAYERKVTSVAKPIEGERINLSNNTGPGLNMHHMSTNMSTMNSTNPAMYNQAMNPAMYQNMNPAMYNQSMNPAMYNQSSNNMVNGLMIRQ